MNAQEIAKLAGTLSLPALKSKHLSTENFFNLIAVKKKVRERLTEIVEAEMELVKAFGAKEEKVSATHVIYKSEDKEFYEKLEAIQQKKYDVPGLNFMTKEEFKPFVDELDVDAAEFLFDKLVKQDA